MEYKPITPVYDCSDKTITPFEIPADYALSHFKYSDFVTVIYDRRNFRFITNPRSAIFSTSDCLGISWRHLVGLQFQYLCSFSSSGIRYIRNNELDVVFKVHICF